MKLIQSLITSSSQAQTRSSQPYSRIVINKTVYFTVNFKERRTLTELKFSYHNSAAFVGLDPQVEVFLITHNDTHKRQTPMLPAGFERVIPASERPQTLALDRSAVGTGRVTFTRIIEKRRLG